ncbi:hypothetical protein V6N11_077068 [Hibiscus sabdariffa]|uniref:RNase H type-1 domain-containing protein n=1 Tax=Hibiscus sabdariffa TaxID=183260 RepID=A0ABR2TCQ7_9ROSI
MNIATQVGVGGNRHNTSNLYNPGEMKKTWTNSSPEVTIHPLDDVWIPSLGPLRPHLLSSVDASQVHSLLNFSDDHGNWDTRKLSTLFNNAVIPYILSIRYLDPSDLPDRPIWSLNGKHSFDIKSAYSSLLGSSWKTESQSWKKIWSLQVPQRFCFFLWLSLKGRHGPFFRSEFVDWLQLNMGSHELHPSRGLPWSMLFISTIWQLWKARNDLVFNDAHFNDDILLQRIHWKLPELGWVCLTTDGAVSLRTGIGSVGGVFQADDGSWITGFNNIIGIVCPLQTELWGIFLGLQLAWENGFERLLIQFNSKEAIKRLTSMQASSDPCSLVRAIARIRHRGWATEIQWIPHEGNKPTNMLAKLDNLPNYDVTIFSPPPESLLPLLDFDMSHSL